MSMQKQIVSAVLLMSVFAPAVRADLVADPSEFKQLKKLTGVDKQNNSSGKSGSAAANKQDAKKTAGEKTAAKVTVKMKKTDGKATVITNEKAKVNSSTTTSSEKSK